MYTSRRKFIKTASTVISGSLFTRLPISEVLAGEEKAGKKLSAHLWVYASKFPPHWDATPALEDVFSDLSYAGFDGIELMESVLRHDNAVRRLKDLIKKYKIAVTGTSYGAQLWKQEKQDEILQDIVLITSRLKEVGGSTLGISVGDAGRKKTEAELDIQAETLQEILKISDRNNVTPNLHNHTYELADNMYDFKETMVRVPDLKLGPDLNWLVRGGIDPVWFIENYGQQMVYMHIRDQKKDGKWTEAVGEGVMDFPAIAKALKKIGFKGEAAVELAFDAPPVRSVRENWKLSRQYVKNIFGF